MKKYIYSFLVLFVSCALVTSCNDDDNAAPKGSPAKGAVGEYTGTWTQENETEGTSVDFTGSVTLSSKDNVDYITYIDIAASGDEAATKIDGKNTYANIVNRTTGYAFSNHTSKAGDLGTESDGVIEDGVMTMKLLVVINKRVGRKTVQQTTYYTFKGKKKE